MKRYFGTLSLILITIAALTFATVGAVSKLIHDWKYTNPFLDTSSTATSDNATSGIGRYQMLRGGNDVTFLVDTKTGETWKYAFEKHSDGSQTWAWNVVGFFTGDVDPTTKKTRLTYKPF